MTFGIGGFLMIFVTAYADFWKSKSLLVSIVIACYGAFTIPVYWLKDPTVNSFNSLIALYIVFGVFTFIEIALTNIYIPHCMRLAENKAVHERQENTVPDTGNEVIRDGKKQRYGFSMSVYGQLATSGSGSIMLAVVTILAGTLGGKFGQNAGLIVTTVFGFITVMGTVVCFLGLPVLPSKPLQRDSWKMAILELLVPFQELLLRKKNMLFLLAAYTIYTDTLFALASVTTQLFFTEIQPTTLEFSLYSMAGNLFSFAFTLAFFLFQSWARWNMEKWLIFGYALILVIPIWGCIGLADVNFGFKNRWEFYVQNLIFYLSGAIVNPTWRLLYSDLVPKGEEVMWFGMQVIVSCATTWVSYVATGPLQNATHNLRFPLIICLIFLMVPVVLEWCRASLGVFERDRLHWKQEEIGKERQERTFVADAAFYRTSSEKGVSTPTSEIQAQKE
ncbi:hypothetical protein H2200_008987 [Cladophialophora chaetospira]|uniref:Autophagy-related protein n=1 Tax=Cladophialophora chaetospira TaxID=386627 RepID=A0AA38X581_9EURO|nr:hypothetical protein H2200_008987 [Cladophialophora chaetospira]